MKIQLFLISQRRSGPTGSVAELIQLYLDRSTYYASCSLRFFSTEEKLLNHIADIGARTQPMLILADSRGQQITSEDLAKAIGFFQDIGVQQLILAIGPADGWSAAALSRADRTIAFGRITLPHELAAVVAAEQIYRALTIRAGHPYHSGH